MAPVMDISHFLQKYLLVAVGEAASPSVDVVMGLVSVMVRVTGRTALGWGEGAKTGVKWPGTFPTTWPLLLGYKTKTECRVKQSKRQPSQPTAPLGTRSHVGPAHCGGEPRRPSQVWVQEANHWLVVIRSSSIYKIFIFKARHMAYFVFTATPASQVPLIHASSRQKIQVCIKCLAQG